MSAEYGALIMMASGQVRRRSRSRSPGLLPTPETTALYVNYPHPVSLPRDSEFIRIFGMFGALRRVFVHRSPRIYAIIDFERSQDAAQALAQLNADSGGLRAQLGDSRLSLSFKKGKAPPKPCWSGRLQVRGHGSIAVTARTVEGPAGTVLAGSEQLTASQLVPVTAVLAQEVTAVLVFAGLEGALSEVGTWLYSAQKAGVAVLQEHRLYLLPPGPDAGQFAPVESGQLLGVLCRHDSHN